MTYLAHILLFLVSAGVVWFFAGLLVDAVDRVAKRFHTSGFTVAFVVLGFLTSISEISVMVNSTINRTPEVSAGNLSGASFVILLFIVPLMAIVGNGIRLKNTISRAQLALVLFVSVLPTLFLLDGGVNVPEGAVCLLVYGTLLYLIKKSRAQTVPKIMEEVTEELVEKNRATSKDLFKILIGAFFIFLAGHYLVEEAVYFSLVFSVPASIIGLLVLSIGTNVPEIVIATRAMLKKRQDIAFGDYVGSALANTAIFGVLALANRDFLVEGSEFAYTSLLMVFGFIAFYFFARSANRISRKEGIILAGFYFIFVVLQFMNFVKFATDRS